MNVQVSTVVMMLVLGSLALIGVGVSILIDDNIRIGLVKDYKEKYEAFAVQKGRFRRTRFEADIGAGNRVPLERFEGQENIGGFTGDLPSPKADTFGWSALLPATESWTIYQFVDDAPPAAGASFVVPRLSVAVPSSNQLVCTPDNFDRQTGTCPDDFLQRMCHEISGDDSVGTVNKDPAITGECPRDNVICGTCDFNYYLNTRVEYVVWSGASENRWRMAANLGWPEYPQGRRYPFNLSDQEFTFEFKNPMNFTLKPIGDPYSVAQNLTEGAMDFGETLDDQRRTGLIMIATGSITFLICTGAMAAMRYMTVKANQQREAAAKEAAQGLNANGNANANDPNAAAGAAAAGGGAAVAQANNPNPQLQQQAANNDGSGGWNGNQQNQQQQQGQQQGQQGQGGNNSGWGNANNGGQNNNGGGGGWGNPAQGGGQQNPMNQFNNNNGNNNGNGNGDGWGNQDDADFRAVGPGAHGNRYNRNGRGGGGGGRGRRQHGGYGSRGGPNGRRNSNNSGSGNGGGSSNGGGGGSRNYSSGGSRSRGGGFQSHDDSRSQRSGGSGSAQIAQALRRGPSNSRAAASPSGGGRHRSNSRSRGYQRIEDDPDL